MWYDMSLCPVMLWREMYFLLYYLIFLLTSLLSDKRCRNTGRRSWIVRYALLFSFLFFNLYFIDIFFLHFLFSFSPSLHHYLSMSQETSNGPFHTTIDHIASHQITYTNYFTVLSSPLLPSHHLDSCVDQQNNSQCRPGKCPRKWPADFPSNLLGTVVKYYVPCLILSCLI